MALRNASPKRNRGLTLVELMIAISIIAVAMFAILSMIVHMMSIREAARESELAKEWVQKKIEEVKSHTYGELKTTAYVPAGGATFYKGTFSGAATPSQLANAAGVLRIDYTNADLVEIIATITWKGRIGKGEYSMRNLYAK